ncbi:hypothetical protein BJP36_37265 [Moorena producens JHB]|uniref:Uncharacterized protein n=1 Tax=Moorena producens (strain JHB) TaxID=1454205 RepID=A0A9Q9SU82_MOOP1|nr:hypothetical protein [Moorena producens]WAN69745.1 hypothetical protein BJP36_37265 [Moorena producens JHB]
MQRLQAPVAYSNKLLYKLIYVLIYNTGFFFTLLLPTPLLSIPDSRFPIPDSLQKFVTKLFQICYNIIFFVL